MSYGITAQIRVNPRNVQLALAMARRIGMDVEKESFAAIISAVLSTSLETWIEIGALTEPDPFAYSREAGRFVGGKNSRDKRARSEAARQMAEHGGKVPAFLRNTIAAPLDARREAAERKAKEFDRLEAERLGRASEPPKQDEYLQGISNRNSADLDQYPEAQTEAHEVASDDALAVRYLALHQRREAGGLTEGEQAEYLRLNHLLFDGK